MMHRRHADRRGIERADGCQTSLDRLEGWNVEPLRGFSCNRGVVVDDSRKLDWLACLLEFAIDAKMVAPEGSGSDNSDPKWMR